MEELMLSTKDNPYNPFENFEEWYAFDKLHGHQCCEIIDRLAITSSEFPEEMNVSIINDIIKAFVEADPLGLYIYVSK